MQASASGFVWSSTTVDQRLCQELQEFSNPLHTVPSSAAVDKRLFQELREFSQSQAQLRLTRVCFKSCESPPSPKLSYGWRGFVSRAARFPQATTYSPKFRQPSRISLLLILLSPSPRSPFLEESILTFGSSDCMEPLHPPYLWLRSLKGTRPLPFIILSNLVGLSSYCMEYSRLYNPWWWSSMAVLKISSPSISPFLGGITSRLHRAVPRYPHL